MAEQEKTPSELRAELRRDTEGALLEAIKAAADKRPGPESLRALAEAYVSMIEHKLPAEKAEGESGRPSGQRATVLR